jgi:hypothetical protein
MAPITNLFHGSYGKGQQQNAWANLDKLFGTSSTAAAGSGAAGKEDLGAATDYFKNLVSGNRQSIERAAAPGANAATAAGDAAKRQRATMGTQRTGGDTAANAQIEDQTRSSIDNFFLNAQPAAAGQLANIGEAEISQALQALGLAEGAAGTEGSQATSQYQYSNKAATEAGGGLADTLFAVLSL